MSEDELDRQIEWRRECVRSLVQFTAWCEANGMEIGGITRPADTPWSEWEPRWSA